MPRNVSGIYSIPPGTEGIPDTTIESVRYNAFVHDVETDLNDERPIIAGGTGANTADAALANLGGEKATQEVTNYDTHVWKPGSFWSATTATAPPVTAHAFSGISYTNGIDIVVEATDLTDAAHKKWTRAKVGGVWSSWSDATLDSTKVAKTGDTMTGPLILAPLGTPPTIILNKNADGIGNQFIGEKNGVPRWILQLGDTDAELGGDTGSHFNLFACTDGGGASASSLHGDRVSGLLTVKGNPVDLLGVAPKQYVDNADSSVMSAVNASKVSKTGDVMSGPLNVGGTVQYNALISGRLASYGANFEWGHVNTAGYGSVLGNDVTAGTPFIALCCGPGTTANTYRTFGIIGSLIKPDGSGGIKFAKVPLATADNQALVDLLNVQGNGQVTGPAVATAVNFWNNGGQLVTTGSAWNAAAVQALVDAAVITLDLAAGINFFCNVTATGRTMGPPANVKPGQAGSIWFYNGVGGATITSWDSRFKFPGGVKPVMSTAGGAIDMLHYIVLGSGDLYCTFQNGFA